MMRLQTNDTIFHNWKVNRVIGSGSFGTVYEIEREEFGRIYKAAAKVIMIPDDSNNRFMIAAEGMNAENTIYYYKSLVEDIIRECDVMERMKGDSHIVSFEDHYVEELENGRRWVIYIRMELLKPLISYITDGDNFLKRDEIIKIGIDICKGLEVCEKFNVVHRDIKLENIFVSDTGKYKLGDFGISKVVDESELAVSQKGTKLYMAPEMFRGDKYDATVDIYSLGLVLYRLLNNNRAPFMPDYPERIGIQDKEIALQRRLAGEILPNPCNADEKLSKIVKKACCFIPRERYQTPSEMRMALEGVLSHSKELYSVVNDTDNTSKTLHVQNMIGQYSVARGNKGLKKSNTIKKIIGNVIVVVMICMALITVGVVYGKKIPQNTWAKGIECERIKIVEPMKNRIEELVSGELVAAEIAFQESWVIVPQVVGIEESTAIELLMEAGYTKERILVSYEFDSVAMQGFVIYQSVEPEIQVKKGADISIIVSKGKKVITSTKKQSDSSSSNVKWKTLE